jgi:hypothetical protein
VIKLSTLKDIWFTGVWVFGVAGLVFLSYALIPLLITAALCAAIYVVLKVLTADDGTPDPD